MLIKQVRISNLLSYGPNTEFIELGPLNVLIGPNGSGKSNFLEALSLLQAAPGKITKVKKQEKTLFSHIVIDSNSGPERLFAQACEDNDDVLFYIKLPKWFQIDTPVGTYNPDWALAYKNDQVLYFVAETKNTGGSHVDLGLLRPIEDLRIECGRRHFKNFEEVRFRAVSSLTKLLD